MRLTTDEITGFREPALADCLKFPATILPHGIRWSLSRGIKSDMLLAQLMAHVPELLRLGPAMLD